MTQIKLIYTDLPFFFGFVLLMSGCKIQKTETYSNPTQEIKIQLPKEYIQIIEHSDVLSFQNESFTPGILRITEFKDFDTPSTQAEIDSLNTGMLNEYKQFSPSLINLGTEEIVLFKESAVDENQDSIFMTNWVINRSSNMFYISYTVPIQYKNDNRYLEESNNIQSKLKTIE